MLVAALVMALAAVVAGTAFLVERRRHGLERTDLVAERRRADELTSALQDVTEQLGRITVAFDAVPLGVVLCDAQGREVLHNDTARSFIGARHGEALVEQTVQDQLRLALREASVRRQTIDLFGPPPRSIVVTVSPVEGGGAVAVIDDVTERRRLESMRRDFIANISHELKTPVGALGVLAEAIAGADPADVRRLVDRMTAEALRVGSIIDDLLALSQIEAESERPSTPVVVRDVVDRAMQRVRPLAEDHRIDIDDHGVDAAHVVLGEPRQLVSALTNLLENACKYTEEGSTVTIRSRSLPGWVEVDVEDRGIGIPSSDLDRVFERFYRVDRARSRDTGGTGLGLAIVRHVASNHGGQATVRSIEGMGSVFTLRLPAMSDQGVAR